MRIRRRRPSHPGDATTDRPVNATQPSGADPLAEVEAFLLGRSVDYFHSRGQAVPPWAWLNSLAHCPPAAVEDLSRPRSGQAPAAWADAVGAQSVQTMAIALWDCAGGDAGAICSLQQELLTPLELALLAGWTHAGDARGVAQLAVATLRARRCPPAASDHDSSNRRQRS